MHASQIAEWEDGKFVVHCICGWQSPEWRTRLGAERAAEWHDENGDRLSGEHTVVEE